MSPVDIHVAIGLLHSAVMAARFAAREAHAAGRHADAEILRFRARRLAADLSVVRSQLWS